MALSVSDPRRAFAGDKSSVLESDGISRQSNDAGDQPTSLIALTAHAAVIELARRQKTSPRNRNTVLPEIGVTTYTVLFSCFSNPYGKNC